MTSKVKRHLVTVLKISLALGLIVYLVRAGHLDPKDLWRVTTPGNVALGLMLVGAGVFMAAWRWILLLRSRGFVIPLGYGLSLYLIGIFFNHALPGAVGGDFVRGYYLVVDHPGRRADGILSILIDRALGLYSFFILSLTAVLWDWSFVMSHEKIKWVAKAALLLFVAMTLFFLVAFSRRLSRRIGLHWLETRVSILHQLLTAFRRFGEKRSVVFTSILVSILAQGFTMLFFYQVAIALGETAITWKAIAFAVPMGFLVTAVPIAPAGIGVGQVAFLYLFQIYLESPTQYGALAITAFQMAILVWGLLGAVLYLRRRKPHDFEKLVAAESEGQV
jgi:glycosyltransferase 2 family protein